MICKDWFFWFIFFPVISLFCCIYSLYWYYQLAGMEQDFISLQLYFSLWDTWNNQHLKHTFENMKDTKMAKMMMMMMMMMMMILENVPHVGQGLLGFSCGPSLNNLVVFLHYLFVSFSFLCFNNIFLFAASTFLFWFISIPISIPYHFQIFFGLFWSCPNMLNYKIIGTIFLKKSHFRPSWPKLVYMHIAPAWLREWIRSARKCTGWSQLEQPAFDFSLSSLIFTFLMVQK